MRTKTKTISCKTNDKRTIKCKIKKKDLQNVFFFMLVCLALLCGYCRNCMEICWIMTFFFSFVTCDACIWNVSSTKNLHLTIYIENLLWTQTIKNIFTNMPLSLKYRIFHAQASFNSTAIKCKFVRKIRMPIIWKGSTQP